MDDLIEFVLEIILGIVEVGAESKKAPKAIRVILFSIIFIFYLSIIGVILYFCLFSDSGFGTKLIFLGIDLILIFLFIKFIKRILGVKD